MSDNVGIDPWAPLPDHPVGRYAIFSNAIASGFTVAQIADHYKLPEHAVSRYLELAKVHPLLLVAYRKDKLTRGQIFALSWLDDKDVQLELYNQLDPSDKGIENIILLLQANFYLHRRK